MIWNHEICGEAQPILMSKVINSNSYYYFFTAITNVSRGKNTTQSSTYEDGTSDKAVDGNYNNTDLEQCATLLSNRTTRSSPRYVTWEVDLEDLYAIASVTIYNTAVLPGIIFSYECYCRYNYC